MALPKLYDRIYWNNDTEPALNEDNLNAMSKGLDDVDDRLIDLAGTILEDVPQIQQDMEILGPAVASIASNVQRAETAADDAEADALKSEGYAVGTQDGVEVTSGEYYQNNAKYYAEIANPPIENIVDFTDIITISDAINKAAKDVKLKVEAVQDLHGYNNPWVGGVGKNKIPLIVADIKANNTPGTWNGNAYTLNNVTFTIQTDSSGNITGINVNGTASSETQFLLYSNNAENFPFNGYILSGCPSGGGNSTYDLRLSDVLSGSVKDFGSGVTATLSNTGQWVASIVVRNGVAVSNKVYKPMISTSGGDYEPYTNICPISGWDNAKVTRSGKNLLPVTATTQTINGVTFTVADDGSITVNGTATALTTLAVASNFTTTKDVIMSGCPTGGSSSSYQLDTIGITPQATDTGAGATIASGQTISTIRIRIANGYTANNVVFKPMIRLATESDATFEPYQGEELTISLNGTRYGGTLDVTSGVLTVDRAVIDENVNWSYASSPSSGGLRYVTYQDSSIKTNGNAITNMLPVDNINAWTSTTPVAQIFYNTGEHGMRIYGNFSSKEDFKSKYSGLQFVYELATPQTIQLTPTQVYLLYGYNTLFGDCGDISLTYDASGIIHIEEAKLDTETLKTIAAASSDFADFKARIAAL